jgi:hypothetical protein
MKRFFYRLIVVLMLSGFVASASVLAQQNLEPLTNTAIIKLVRAGFKEKSLIAIIRSRPNRFDLSADRLIELKHTGVTENVILAMINQDERQFAASGDWVDDDTFFNKGGNSSRGNRGDAKKQDGADIFGSSGSSNGESHGPGRNDSNQGNSVTTGTATVRILRPPVEEGGAAVKLEKTPTLNNESIINLVAAGFSEGTIVKRIEDSPAEFDLSPAKLTELRKRRVTEPVIAAMTAAMSDESGPKNSPREKSPEN